MSRDELGDDVGHEGIQPGDEKASPYYLLFAGTIFVILSVFATVLDLYVFTMVDISRNLLTAGIVIAVNVFISWLFGGYIEYCRLRFKQAEGGDDV